jgi:hypothetical protein
MRKRKKMTGNMIIKLGGEYKNRKREIMRA